jgi:hypothetical protein
MKIIGKGGRHIAGYTCFPDRTQRNTVIDE